MPVTALLLYRALHERHVAQVEFHDLMVQTAKCLGTSNDTESALRYDMAMAALARLKKVSFDITVGNDGMPPARKNPANVVRYMAHALLSACWWSRCGDVC